MIETEAIKPRIYINSFPKSGTHLAKLITAHMARMQEPQHWIGTFTRNSWTTEWIDIDHRVIPVIEGQPEGTWMIGHCGYKPEIGAAFERMGTCMIFVYRDLRDVAVSQTYHIENPDDKIAKHPNKAKYMALPSHTDRIKAVIEGLDEYPGLIERWELFAPWLDANWIMPVRYEEMRLQPRTTAQKVITYIIQRTADHQGFLPIMVGENYSWAIATSVELMATTEYSGSFRKGKVGNWRDEFTLEVAEAFERAGGNEWIERLGYEQTELIRA